MGLFSTKKKTVVSSAVYNLAGDKISDFLRQSATEALVLGELDNFTNKFFNALTSCEGFKIRRYIRWCKSQVKGRQYCNLIGHTYLSYGYSFSDNYITEIFKDSLNLSESQNVKIDFIEIDKADYYYWGAQYLDENYPQYTDDTLYSFTCDLNNQTIIIHIFDTSQNEIDTLSFTPSNYDPDKTYLYVAYQIYNLDPIYQLDEDDHIVYDTQHNPIILGYEEPESIIEDLAYLIYAEDTSSTNPNYNIALSELLNSLGQNTARDIFILPPIPFRLDNWQVSSAEETNINDWNLYQLSKTACRKIFYDNKTYKKLDEAILKNPSLEDLDYIYLIFGVSLNTKNWAGKRYLYDYIASLYQEYVKTGSTYIDIKAQGYKSNFEYRIKWDSIEYGTMSSTETFYSIPPDSIHFSSSTAEVITPFANTTSKKDKYDIFHTVEAIEVTHGSERTHVNYTNGWTYFVHRETINSTEYTYYKVKGLVHYNRVHKGKEVRTRAREVWYKYTESVIAVPQLKTEYEESPFIFPLQENIYRNLPILTQAQLSMSFAYLQFNCYEIQKIKWYQSAWFKVVIAVVIIVIQAVTFYFTVGTSSTATQELGTIGQAVESAVSASLGQTAAHAVAALVELAATAIIGAVVAKLVILGLDALGLNNFLVNIIGTIAGIVAGYAFSSWNAAGAEATSLETVETVEEQMFTELIESYAVQVTAIANETAIPSMFTLFKDGLFNFLTSPLKIANFSLSITEATVKGYYQDKWEELKKTSKQIAVLQGEIEKQEKQIANMSPSSYSEWQKQMLLWKTQTDIKPETYLSMSLLAGSEVTDLTINAITEYLNLSATLEYV